jgi:hypothetical protein
MAAFRQITAASTLVALLTACTANTAPGAFSSPPPSGTLHGDLLMAGGPAPGSPRPGSGWISITQGSTLITKMQVTGSFTQVLPAGTYTLTSTTGGPACQSATFTITPGKDTATRVTCDIR